MKNQYGINHSPSITDLEKIKTFLIKEKELYKESYYENWNIIKKSFDNGDVITFEENGTPIGFVVWTKSDRFASIEIMVIRHNFRGMGLGKMFFNLLSKSFIENGILAIEISYEPDKHNNIFIWAMDFIPAPTRGYDEPNLAFKPLIDVCEIGVSDELNKIELWDVEPWESFGKSPRWSWNIDSVDGRLIKPIIHVCNMNWNIRLTVDGKIKKKGKVKYFSNEHPIDFSPFMYIEILPK